jgi:two-component system, OmpR family, sensor histidine kinase BaeS
VVCNLLRNALTHTPAGGTVRVTVERCVSGVGVAIAVHDTGRGIPAQHLPLIWERFHRVDPSRDRASGGMGLGLAVVRQLVLGMGGSVDVASREGEGSTFTVTLAAG